MEEPKIIFEDESLFVLQKPTGWITNDADTTRNQPVIQKWIRDNFDYPLKGNRELRDGIVHRLDKETSGILLVAKTKEAFDNLQSQFKNRLVTKTYLALVHGKVREIEGQIDQNVGRLPWRRDRFGVLLGGREAVTLYKVKQVFTKKDTNEFYTLLEVKPKTGRTHQIRIHLKYLGNPIVGDEFYAGRKTSRNDRKWCKRLMLSANEIEFSHPKTNKKVSYKLPIALDMREALDKLIQVE